MTKSGEEKQGIIHPESEADCLSPLPVERREREQKQEKEERWRGRKKQLHSKDYKRRHLTNSL